MTLRPGRAWSGCRGFARRCLLGGGAVCLVGTLALPFVSLAGAQANTSPSPTAVVATADPQGLYEQVRQHLAAHEWAAAEQVLSEWVTAWPDDTRARLMLGMLLAPVQPERAVPWLEQATADPTQGEVARQLLEVIARHQQRRTDFYTVLGLTFCQASEWALAERALRLAVDANATNAVALAYLGYALDQQGEDGWPWLEQARAMAPTEPQVLYLVGLHWRQSGDLSAARHALLQAYWAAPDNPALAAEVGRTLQALGDLAGAEQWLRIAISLGPGEEDWIELLAVFYAETGFGLDEAGMGFLQQASADYPGNSAIHASLGWVLQRQGDIEGALAELQKATELDPANPRAQYYLGAVLERLGQADKARAAYSATLALVAQESFYGELAARGLARLSARLP